VGIIERHPRTKWKSRYRRST